MAKKKPRLSPEFLARDAELRREIERLIEQLKREQAARGQHHD